MTDYTPHDAGRERRDKRPNPFNPVEVRAGWLQRRRDKMVAEIQRNRRGEYTVPTWVLLAILIAIVAAWVAVVIFL